MSVPEGSHGTRLQVALNTAAPTVFTDIGKVQDIQFPPISRAQTLSSGQEDLISSFVSTTLLMVGSVDVTVWYSSVEPTHNATVGAALGGLYLLIMSNTTRPFRFKGPKEALDIIDVIARVSDISKGAPVNEGVYEATITLQPTGILVVEGVTIDNP